MSTISATSAASSATTTIRVPVKVADALAQAFDDALSRGLVASKSEFFDAFLSVLLPQVPVFAALEHAVALLERVQAIAAETGAVVEPFPTIESVGEELYPELCLTEALLAKSPRIQARYNAVRAKVPA